MLCKLIASALAVLLLVESENVTPKRDAAPAKPSDARTTDAAKAQPKPSGQEQSPPAEKDSQQPASAEKPAKKAGVDLIEVERQIVEKTNSERARFGLPPLVVDRNLVQSARTHAAWMTNRRTLTHTNRPVAENIAMGQRTTGEALSSWMNSSGHRANILSRGHRRIGVAAYRTPEGTIYWCQQFLP